MYDGSNDSPLARAPGEDAIEHMEREEGARRRQRRGGAGVPGHQFTRAAPLSSVAKRLVIFAGQDVATTIMVALIHAENPRLAAYLSAEMRSLNGKPWWRIPSDVVPLTLAQLGVTLELSGRTGGGVSYRARAVGKTVPRIKTSAGRIAWRGNQNEWVRLHPAAEQEMVP